MAILWHQPTPPLSMSYSNLLTELFVYAFYSRNSSAQRQEKRAVDTTIGSIRLTLHLFSCITNFLKLHVCRRYKSLYYNRYPMTGRGKMTKWLWKLLHILFSSKIYLGHGSSAGKAWSAFMSYWNKVRHWKLNTDHLWTEVSSL